MNQENREDKIKNALEEVLKQFDITLDQSEETSEEEQKTERYGDYSEIISKTQEKLDDLNEKGEILLKKTGMTREQIEDYATNSNNFTPEQWEALQKLRAATEEFKRQVHTNIIGEDKIAKSVERKQKKQQHRFGKKKNWIPL